MSETLSGEAGTDAYDTTNWVGLFGAEVAASAALTGLIFVAVSINLKSILAYPWLPRRVLKALCMLCPELFISTFGLVPGQSVQVQGLEVLGLGVMGVIWVVVIDVGIWRMTPVEFRRRPVLLSFGLSATLCTAIAGVSLLAQAGGGLYWLVPAMVLALVTALTDAWVLLIEIVR
jgi:modulator of FtsH protease